MADESSQLIHVIDTSSGTLGTVPSTDVKDAISSGGYRLAKPEEIQSAQDEQIYGQGVGSAIKAFGLGAARSGSFGLSDQFLVHSGMMKPEELANYNKYRPGYTTAGEFGGVLGAVIAPETGILGALSAPVRAVSGVGNAVTRGAAAVLPEATSAVGRVVTQAGAHLLGSAVEGAAYGGGQSVSEQALGDPDLNGEKVIANIGKGALFGAAVGTLFGAAKGAIQSKVPTFLSEVDKSAIDSGNFETMVRASEDISDADKQGFIAGLAKEKSNANEIRTAANDLGAPVLPSMTSDNKLVQKAESALLEGPPTYPSMKAQQVAAQGIEKAQSAMEDVLGPEADITKASVGDTLKNIVVQNVEKQAEPINALYTELKRDYEILPVNERSIKQIANNIRRIEDVPFSPQAKSIAESAAKRVESLKTVDDVKRLKSIINQELSPVSATPIQKRMTAIIADKLSNLEENSIVAFAKNEMITKVAKNKILQLLDQREAANAQYSVFKDKLSRLGEVLGRKNPHGAQDFLDFLNDLTPEKVADKLSGKNNSQFLKWFSEEFPEGMKAISDYQKGLIRNVAQKGERFDINGAIKHITDEKKMPTEYREKIFNPDEIKKINSVKTYMDAFPKNLNLSNTDNSRAFRAFFEHGLTGAGGAAMANVRDFGIQQFLNAATKSSDQSSAFISGLSTVERTVQKTTKAIDSSVNAIFNNGAVKIYPVLNHKDKKDNHDDLKDKLSQHVENPQQLIDHLNDTTKDLSQYAPKTAQSVQMTVSRATQFLQSKLPGNNIHQAPLGHKYIPSKVEISKWHSYYNVVENPILALHQVSNASIIPETMEALEAVYPKLLSEMQTTVMDHMTKAMAKKQVIPYRTKLALSMFLGSDLVSSLSPQSMLATQNVMSTATQAKQSQEQGQLSGSAKKSIGKMDSKNRLLTSAQSSAQRQENV